MSSGAATHNGRRNRAISDNARTRAEAVHAAIESERGSERFTERDLLVYVHIPFCSSKCSFCHWVSGISARQLRSGAEVRAQYVEALTEQIAEYGPQLADLGYVPRFVYWGGGTPSILSTEQIETLGDAIQANFDLRFVNEYSVEASPETLTPEKIDALLGAGMTRLSIGIQSFDDAELRRSARAHSSDQARASAHMAKARCENLNIDLIVGLPGQTEATLGASLASCIDIAPEHVTAYEYLPAGGTVMYRQIQSGHLRDLSRSERARALGQARRALSDAGYVEYMPMYYALHGEKPFGAEYYYFELRGDYFGFGSGPHSRVAHHLLINQRGELDAFLAEPTAFDVCQRISKETPDGYGPALGQALRLGQKISYARFRDAFGFDFNELLNTEYLRHQQAMLGSAQMKLVTTDTQVYAIPE